MKISVKETLLPSLWNHLNINQYLSLYTKGVTKVIPFFMQKSESKYIAR
jgi:hypothetical protein